MTSKNNSAQSRLNVSRAHSITRSGYRGIHKEMLRNINGVLILASVAEDHGMKIEAFLKGSGLDVTQINRPTTTISYEQEYRLIRNLLEHCGEQPGLGCEAGEKYQLTTLAAVGFAIVSCDSLRTAFNIVFRYEDLHASMVRNVFVSEINGGLEDLTVRYIEEELPKDVRQFVIERTASAECKISSLLLGRRLVPRRWDVTWSEPTTADVYERHLGIRPRFAQKHSILSIAQTDADASFTQCNSLALKLAEENCRQYIASWRARAGISAQVRDIISIRSDGMPTMELVADQMHMSVRTLRRRLAREGVTYSDLCDEVRQALAETLLTMRRLPVEQIAERLGYADSSGFIHAFKRWTGETPSAFRAGIV